MTQLVAGNKSNLSWQKMQLKGVGTVQLLYLLLLISGSSEQILAKKLQKRGVMDGFNEGIKYAGKMFGINTAADVANLVAKAFSSTSTGAARKRPDFMSIFQQRESQQQKYSEEAQDTAETQKDDYSQEQQETQQGGHTKARPTSQPAREPGGLDFNGTSLITTVLRMIGFDASKLGALAINALIMIAQTIGSTLMSATKRKRVGSSTDGVPEALYADEKAHEPRELPDDTPIDWFLHDPHVNGPKLQSLLSRATDAKLSDQLLNMIETMEVENGQGACLKLLMCKSTPFIWSMQKSLRGRYGSNVTAVPAEEAGERSPNAKALFRHLPGLTEYRANSEQCEERYANYCNRTDLYKPPGNHGGN